MRTGCNLTFKKNIVDDLLGGQSLFKILHTSLAVKSDENVEKSKRFKKFLRWRPLFFSN